MSTPPTTYDLAVDRTDLALERTVMAAGRTLMAWIRTGLSQISFGFALYKFLQATKINARALGLVLIGLGTLSVLVGAVEYIGSVNHLNRMYGGRYPRLRYHLGLAIVVGLFGMLLFLTILVGRELF